jgi:hypothetical protein
MKSLNHFAHLNIQNTVKLGYNKLGYYELTVITNKIILLVGSDLFYVIFFLAITNRIPVITNKIEKNLEN